MKHIVKAVVELHVGRDDAINVHDIATFLSLPSSKKQFGFKKDVNDTRVRQTVRSLIKDGACIGSCRDGYFMITTHEEAIEAIGNLTKRRDALNRRIDSLLASKFYTTGWENTTLK
jgi:hypothetical protein